MKIMMTTMMNRKATIPAVKLKRDVRSREERENKNMAMSENEPNILCDPEVCHTPEITHYLTARLSTDRFACSGKGRTDISSVVLHKDGRGQVANGY